MEVKVGFSNKKFCKCIKKNDRKFPIDGTKVKKLLMRSKFPDVSVYLNPIILNYCTKNIKKLQKKNLIFFLI